MFCNNCGNEITDKSTFCNACGAKMSEKTENRRQCCICGNENLKDDATILLVDTRGNCMELCDKCTENMEKAEKQSSLTEVKEAIKYFNAHIATVSGIEVKKFLAEVIEKGRKYISENSGEDNSDIGRTDSSIWVSGLRAVAWLIFAAVIIIGITLCAGIGGAVGFLIFAVSIPIAFFSVAGIMIFLDIAADIRAIKNELIKRRG